MGSDVVITGAALVSHSDTSLAAAAARLANDGHAAARAEEFAPVPIAEEIPNHSDQRAMGPTMLAATFAAGKALGRAGLKGDHDRLARTDIITSGRCTERDEALEAAFRESVLQSGLTVAAVNEGLRNRLRPTLFLTQLPNLISANISIVHGVVGRSQTFLGEEPAGMAAIATAFERVASGMSEHCLVGGVFRGNGVAFREAVAAFPEAAPDAAGTAAAFLVLERAETAKERGQTPLAQMTAVWHDASDRDDGACPSQLIDLLAGMVSAETCAGLQLYSAAGYGESARRKETRLWRDVGRNADAPPQVRHLNQSFGALFEASAPCAAALAAHEIGAAASSEHKRRAVVVCLGTFAGECAISLEQVA